MSVILSLSGCFCFDNNSKLNEKNIYYGVQHKGINVKSSYCINIYYGYLYDTDIIVTNITQNKYRECDDVILYDKISKSLFSTIKYIYYN